ncbi:MAG TPA: NAD-dependent epimerase [Parapedobacter sp.]|nr:NAD-dependent epimerase [Parapedobacter sp.]
MKILVTGAAGFIGFYTVKALLNHGSEIVGIDNINDYYDTNLKYGRLAECGVSKETISTNQKVRSSINSKYCFQKGDLTDLQGLEALFANERFDYVIHLAAQPGVRYSLENPHAYIQSNIVGFMNVLECCRYHGVKHLVYASSSSIYGMNDKIPFSEDDRVDYPVSVYAATKKSNELLAHTYSHLYQLPTTGLRFFTVYGPWGRPDMAPMLFADAISQGKPIKVFNGGDMLRDFTYVDDIVEGVIQATENIPTEQEVQPYYRLCNIGNSKPIQLMDFIREMEKAMGKEAILEMYPMQPGDVKVTFADTSKLEKITGYRPKTSIETGIASFINWYNGSPFKVE